MIRTEALTKYYGNRCAVRELTLSIDAHEIVGFLGLNGAGKTTTLRMLAGLLAPSSGRILIDGQEMDPTDASGVRWRIGFLPERPPLYEEMTVRAFLHFAANLRGYEKSSVPRRVDEVIELTQTGAYADEPITNLSHGFRQRVGIAQAVVHEPALVILDEPTSGLDPLQIVEMRKLIRELKQRHTVLLSSHNLPEISQTCDRLLVIGNGALVASGSESELSGQMKAGSRITLELSGKREEIDRALAATEKAGLLKNATVSESGGVFNVEAALTTDQPEALSRALLESGVGLRKLAPRALESLFLDLTRTKS